MRMDRPHRSNAALTGASSQNFVAADALRCDYIYRNESESMQMNASVRPKAITLNKNEHYLEIVWNDEQVCHYPLSELREACPCVQCRGGHEFMGREYDPSNLLELKPKRSYAIQTIEPVGNYALQPVWDDGHDSGIYTWDYLKRLCPAGDPSR